MADFALRLWTPGTSDREAAANYFIGRINFFDAVDMPGHEGHGAHPLDMTFDVTSVAAKLRAQGQIPDKAVVHIVPAGKPAEGSEPMIRGGIELRSE